MQHFLAVTSTTPRAGVTGVASWMYIRKGADHIGEVQAWDLDTGKKVWTTNFGMSQNWGPILATAGDLLFLGGTDDGSSARWTRSPASAWETVMPSGVTAFRSSFQVDGKHYVAVQCGWGVDAARMQRRLNLLRPGAYPEVPQGGSIWVFAVD